jgi:DNA-binding transcriptional MerR regulator
LAGADEKSASAFRTIGELSRDTGLPQHILRYWETRFPQLRPLQRAGNRRYYRPSDIALVTRIDALLNREGYTIQGAQKLLAAERGKPVSEPTHTPAPAGPSSRQLQVIRDHLAEALRADRG